MKCGGCVSTVSTEISALEGVSNVSVSLDDHTISFSYNSNQELEIVKNKLQEIGHPVDNTSDLLNKAKSLLNN